MELEESADDSTKEKAFELSLKAEESPDTETFESPPERDPPSELALHPAQETQERRAAMSSVEARILADLFRSFIRSPS